MQEFQILKSESNQTLIKYLNRLLPNAPSGLIYKQLRNKNITLNKKKASGNEKLSENDIVYIYMSDDTILKFKSQKEIDTTEYFSAFSKYKIPEILYEDNHVLIINKPVGMLSQKAKSNDLSANEWLVGYLLSNNKISISDLNTFIPSICNRLDRNTGGLLIFGKTLYGTNIMNSLLRERTAHKYYRTIVQGIVKEGAYIKGYLAKDEKTNTVSIKDNNSSNGEYIETKFVPLRYSLNNNITELEVQLITGKPHQIRAHLSSIGHPIIGDKKYNADITRSFGLNNQLLYAVRFEFPVMDDYKELSGKIIKLDTNNIFDEYFK